MTGKAPKVFICICTFILYAQYAKSEVSDNFQNCQQLFYQNSPPFLKGLVNDKHICQKYKNNNPQFATSYDTTNRIPHYSAYKIESFVGAGCRYNGWFIEPQLSDTHALQYMLPWKQNEEYRYKPEQAVNSDYTRSGYDRGHLNPSGYHCETNERRASTNTLTNVAPQHGSFNQGDWNKLERAIRQKSETYCNFGGANRYFITGVIPSSGNYLKTSTTSRVNIPDYYWTAVCCDSSKATALKDRDEGWSVGFLAENKAVTTVGIYHIQDFLSSRAPNLFKDYVDPAGKIVKNCLFNPTKAETIIDEIATLGQNFVKKTVKPTYFQHTCNAAYSVYCYIRNLFG